MGLHYTYSNTPPQSELPTQTQLATGDVEAGAELGEGRGREALGEDVSELGGGRDIEDPNIADSNPVPNEV